MSAPKDEKYIVFKREDFKLWCREVRESSMKAVHGILTDEEIQQLPNAMDLALDDAVVIRRQDVFSPPALDAYSNAIQTAVEVLRADVGGHNTGLVRRLEEKALYFREQAAAAWDTDRKVPD